MENRYNVLVNNLIQQIKDAEETIKELSAGIGYKEELAKKYWNKYKVEEIPEGFNETFKKRLKDILA